MKTVEDAGYKAVLPKRATVSQKTRKSIKTKKEIFDFIFCFLDSIILYFNGTYDEYAFTIYIVREKKI